MINFRKAHFIYNHKIKLHFRELKEKKKLILKKPYLIISNYFDRYPNASSIFSLETLFNIGYKNIKLDNNLKYSLEKSQNIAYIFGKILGGNFNFSHIKIISILFSLSKFILKVGFAILDLIKTILYSFYYINLIRKNKLLFTKLNSRNQKNNLFTINYWKSKKLNSVNYYYPDLKLDKKDYFIATEFFQYRSIYEGLKDYHKNKNKYLLSALDFISNKDILFVLLLLIDSYIYDFFGKHKYNYGILASNIIKINYLNRNYLYLLNYKCGEIILNNVNFKNIYIWFENQSDTKMFLIGLMNAKIKNKKSNIYSYFGCTSFSLNYHKQLIPNQFELDIGIWGNNKFLVPDQESLLELKDYLNLKFIKNNFKIKKVRKGLRRFKDIEIDFDNKLLKKERKFTFITHGNPKELFQVFLTLFYSKNNFKELIRDEPIFIRLHPSINKKNINYEINLLKKLFQNINLPKLIFIDKKDENLLDTMNKSDHLIFGDSSLINIALLFNYKVISVRTSILYGSPIQRIYENSNNLLKL